jgi:hypothetical protein
LIREILVNFAMALAITAASCVILAESADLNQTRVTRLLDIEPHP